jgi:hypothetical protein
MQYRPDEAVAVAGTARELADQLGLADAAAGAMVTEATARYLGGDPTGVDGLRHAVEVCRAQRLPVLGRAANNLNAVLLEEGDLRGAAEADAESAAARGMRVNVLLNHSAEAERAYFTGDWVVLLQAADAYLDTEEAETTEWEVQLRARRAWIRLLCDEPPGPDIDRCLDHARRSGFDRLRYNACAHSALYHSLQGDHTCAVALLGELTSVWREAPTTMTVEWLSALAHTAALTVDAAGIATEVVATVPRRTRWVEAADALTTGARAAADGRPSNRRDALGRRDAALRGHRRGQRRHVGRHLGGARLPRGGRQHVRGRADGAGPCVRRAQPRHRSAQDRRPDRRIAPSVPPTHRS